MWSFGRMNHAAEPNVRKMLDDLRNLRSMRKMIRKFSEYGGSGPLRFAKPQSCKASLALHASKLQSLKAAKPLWRLTPQSLKAPKPLWRLTPQSLKAAKPLWRLTLQSLKAWKLGCFGALALGGSCTLWRFLTLFRRLKASKPQSLNAWMLWRFGALALGGSFRLWRFLALFRRYKASKPERLDALALWRMSYASKPQSLKAWTLGCFGALALGALALWRFGALALWRFGALALGALDALVPLGPLALCGSLRHAILEKKWFCRFYFFPSTDWNIGIKAFPEKKQRAKLFVFEGQSSPAASELTTTCLVIFVGCLIMMVYLSRWLTSVVCKSPFRGS